MNRAVATGLALTATGLASVPIAEGAKPPKQPKPAKGLTIAAAPNPVVFGRAVVVSGRLSGQKHAGQKVALQADPYPYDRFSQVATALTSANGDVAFQQRPGVNTRYKLHQGGIESAVVTVLARLRTSLRLSDSTPRAGTRVRFAGRACPTHDGSRVAIQRRRSTGPWRTVKRTRLRGASRCSVFAARLRVRRDATYRAVVAGDAAYARGISPRRRVNVR